MTVSTFGRILVGLGLITAVLGAVLWLFGGLPRLPGDIYLQRKGFTLYIPITTGLLLSLLATLLLNVLFVRR